MARQYQIGDEITFKWDEKETRTGVVNGEPIDIPETGHIYVPVHDTKHDWVGYVNSENIIRDVRRGLDR